MNQSSLKRQLGAIGFFVLLAFLALYWPLFHLSTHVPGDSTTDYFHFHWNYWWIRHALTTGVNIYETNFVMFPFVSNLALHTLIPFWFPVWAVLEPLLGTVAAMNIIFAIAMALIGYTFFLLLRREGVPAGLALIGGAVLQLTPAVLGAIVWSDLNYASFFWPALQLLIWGQVVRSVHDPRRCLLWGVVQGLAFYAMAMTDFQYLLYSVFLLVPYGVLTLIEAPDGAARLRLVRSGILAVSLMLVLLWLVGPLPYLLKFDRSTLRPPPAERVHSLPFPAGYFLRFDDYRATITLGSFVVPIMLLTLVASLSVLHKMRRCERSSRRWFWLGLSLLLLILGAGARITVAGLTIPLPYAMVHSLVGGLFRSPERFGTLAIIPAMLFVGQTWKPLLAYRPRRLLGASTLALLAVLYDARLFLPMQIQQPVQPYAFYQKIGQERGKPYDDQVVLEVPVAAGSGEYSVGNFNDLATQFYGMTHGKRMVNGLLARTSVNAYWYLRTDDPMLSWLGQRRLLDEAKVQAQLQDRIFHWPIGYVVVHQDAIGLDSPTNQEIIGYFNSLPGLLCPYTVEGHAVVYRTAWHPDGCPPRTPPQHEPGVYHIDIGAPGDEPFIGWGWHYAENISGVTLRWTGAFPQTKVYVDLPPGDYDVSLSAQAYTVPRELSLLVNGQPLATASDPRRHQVEVFPSGLQTFSFHLPAALVGSGKHLTLTLQYDGWIVPKENPVPSYRSEDTRKLAVAVDWIRFSRNEF